MPVYSSPYVRVLTQKRAKKCGSAKKAAGPQPNTLKVKGGQPSNALAINKMISRHF